MDGTTSTTIVNRALQEIGQQVQVTGVNPTFDGTTAGNYAGLLYTPAVNFLLRQQDWEFAFNQEGLVSAGVPGLPQWPYVYVYPLDCVRVRQIYPATWNALDPQAVRWSFGVGVAGGQETRLIYCNVPGADIAYTTSTVTETIFDAIFEEGLVRYLGSAMAMALAGRPDYAKQMLEWSGGITQSGSGRDS